VRGGERPKTASLSALGDRICHSAVAAGVDDLLGRPASPIAAMRDFSTS